MIDFRHKTFLELCKIGSYTKTAEHLHITQPAVTQHVQFLEEYYGGKLFTYQGKSLSLTERGKLLQSYITTMYSDSEKVRDILSHLNTRTLEPMTFGATLTIGEYVMPPILTELAASQGEIPIIMLVGNTEVLLERLRDGAIDFTLLEGFFDKGAYDYHLFSTEEFIAVCSPISDMAGQEVSIEQLLGERIILREKGSGTRDVFEHALFKHNLTADSFGQLWEIGSMGAIKKLVTSGLGITFMYRAAVDEELKSGQLSQIYVKNFNVKHQFNFVYLKESVHKDKYDSWYRTLRDCNKR